MASESSSRLSQYEIDNENCANDPKSFDIADEQAEILHKGKIIENFIAEWAKTNPPDTCFKLLRVLFKLFKSEVSANIALRKGMVELKKNAERAALYERQMTRLFEVAQEYSPDVSNLSEVLALYKRCRRTPDDAVNSLKEQLLRAQEDYKGKKRSLDRITDELERQRKKLHAQEAAVEATAKEERLLSERLDSLQRENSELMHKLTHPSEAADEAHLKRMIAVIDSRMTELQGRIGVVNQRYHQKSWSLRRQLEQLQMETDDMVTHKRELERALDLIHEKIDMLTNPLTACNDTSLSPHMARVRLGEASEAVELKRKELCKEEVEIEELVKNIQAVKAEMKTVASEIDNGEAALQNLVTERENKQREFMELEMKKAEVVAMMETLDAIDRTKSIVDADNIRLRQELDALKSMARHLVISHNSLVKSADVNEATIRGAVLAKQATAMSADDSSRFDNVLNCFRRIREAYHLPEGSSVRDIYNAVHSRVSSGVYV